MSEDLAKRHPVRALIVADGQLLLLILVTCGDLPARQR